MLEFGAVFNVFTLVSVHGCILLNALQYFIPNKFHAEGRILIIQQDHVDRCLHQTLPNVPT